MKPLIVIPTYMYKPDHLVMGKNLAFSLAATQDTNDFELMIVDDGSPKPNLVDAFIKNCELYNFNLHVHRQGNQGFSMAVNVGLKQAFKSGQDVILCNSDIQFIDKGWIQRFEESNGDVVGALLLYPNGLIQHAGIYYSIVYRSFDHRFHFGPADLAEALVECRCPVTGALQYIRHHVMESIGFYDEGFRLGFEDVDWAHRVFLDGMDCIYQPSVRAIHYESAFRGSKTTPKHVKKWQKDSLAYLVKKYEGISFADFVPTMFLDNELN